MQSILDDLALIVELSLLITNILQESHVQSLRILNVFGISRIYIFEQPPWGYNFKSNH